MCHVVLLLPILGLVLFWFLDFALALPLYLGLVVLSGVVALLTLRSLRKPASSGMEGMRGATAEVVEALRPRGTVRYHSTFWYARVPSAHAVAGGRCGSWATRGSVSGWRG
jgi:membrane protein implicated in regulation of membrane protease activity